MKGIIKTYLFEKEYGFIKGDDKKDYFFHKSSLKDKNQQDKLSEGLYLEFEQKATPKGYSAVNISILDDVTVLKYEVPNDIYISKDSTIKGWEIIEFSDWIVIGSSRNSPDSAKVEMQSKAKELGANSLVNVEYFKTTGSEAGTGYGTYYYTIHNYKGQMVNAVKKSPYGKFELKDFKNINEESSKLKNILSGKTYLSKNFKSTFWMTTIVLIILLFSTSFNKEPVVSIIGIPVLLFIAFIFARSKDYDSWLQKIR